MPILCVCCSVMSAHILEQIVINWHDQQFCILRYGSPLVGFHIYFIHDEWMTINLQEHLPLVDNNSQLLRPILL